MGGVVNRSRFLTAAGLLTGIAGVSLLAVNSGRPTASVLDLVACAVALAGPVMVTLGRLERRPDLEPGRGFEVKVPPPRHPRDAA